jgi:hypothetical protein
MEPISLKVKRALSRLNKTGNPLFTKPLKNWTDEDFSLAKSFLRTARVEEDYTMEDLKKIQEFFSKPLEEISDPRIGNPKFGQAPQQFADLRAKLGDETLLDKIQMIDVNSLRDILDELDSYNLEESSTYNEYSEVGYKKVGEEMMSLDDQAKAYFLEKFKKGEIDSLPDNPKTAFLDQMMKDEMEKDAAQFRSERGLEEGMGGQLDERYFIEVSVRDARKAIDIFDDQYSESDIKMYGSNVYASNSLDSIYDFYYDLASQNIEILDASDFDEDDYEEEDYEETDYMKRRGGDYSDDEFEQSDYMRRRMGMDEVTKGFEERFPKDKLKDYIGKTVNYYGNRFIVKDVDEAGTLTLVDAEDGEERMVNYNMFIQKGLIPELKKKIQETIKLGEGMIEEELCPKGKAYLKRRKAAGEKSSAYLSGRAVKVCKGLMSGTSKKK